ncbi:signal transducer and activator of transcription 5B-like [Dysidea avara]|uniref:signal transducer and activator of transcription 5B-like n=1 Tax=Dysidea avara TaxID=196820 RepID=UPI00331CB026
MGKWSNVSIQIQGPVLTISGNEAFIIRTQLEGLRTHITQNRPLELVRIIQNCLLKESELVKQHENINTLAASPMGVQVLGNGSAIQRGLEMIMRQTQNTQEECHSLHTRQEQFVIQYQEVIKLQGNLTQGQGQHSVEQVEELRKRREKMEAHLAREVEEMHHFRQELEKNYFGLVLDQELANWKRTQRLCGQEEMPNKKELDQLQQWCEQLAELLWRNRIQIRQYETLRSHLLISDAQQPGPYNNLMKTVNELLNKLITECFIVEKQPPQVMKTNNRFTAEVRLLVGNKLNIHMSTPEVSVSIINEKQAKAIFHDPLAPTNDNVGEILNCKKNMEYQQTSHNVCCKFNFMQLKRVKRATDRKGTDQTVTEEKFALLFQSNFSVNGELDVSVKCLSLPVVVVVHGSQQPAAEATIFWDNSFADPDREPFSVPDSVAWPTFADSLNRYFSQQTGKGLSQKNSDYLARRLMSIQNPTAANNDRDTSQFMVTKQIVFKEHLQSRGFTFWEWFYKTSELIKTCLRREWNANLILGFLDKREAHEMLLRCQPGTFIVRFTESEPGGVSIVWVKSNIEKQVYDLAPWNRSHLQGMRSFADRVRDLNHLFLLYPNIQKDEAFGAYYTVQEEEQEFTAQGYLKHDLRVVIPSLAGSQSFTNPNSPASSIMSPLQPSPMPRGGVSPRIDSSSYHGSMMNSPFMPETSDLASSYGSPAPNHHMGQLPTPHQNFIDEFGDIAIADIPPTGSFSS